jgi:hypothetical protein
MTCPPWRGAARAWAITISGRRMNMFVTMLDRLRPKSDTAEEISTALAATEAELLKHGQRVADLEARRGAALLESG